MPDRSPAIYVYACFAAGTLVSTPEGFRNIEDLREGDAVYGWDFEQGTVIVATITRTHVSVSEEIYTVAVGNSKIEVTSAHPFYVEGEGWVHVRDLEVGGALTAMAGGAFGIDSISARNETTTVYNIHVDEVNNYFVSEDELLVHNK
ncbi:MAG: hypothetical protein GY854_20850 [Deltaproteobacteria bacterium]|nr:hypothetical protein [Deltaproteobacteria bacterium]